MQSKDKITRTNAMDIIKRFAKEYRKALGKAPAEIIIVGGGSIMLNYKFRDATHICAKSIEELKNLYDSQRNTESDVGDQLIIYIEEGVNINTKNVSDVAACIREKMNKNQ